MKSKKPLFDVFLMLGCVVLTIYIVKNIAIDENISFLLLFAVLVLGTVLGVLITLIGADIVIRSKS